MVLLQSINSKFFTLQSSFKCWLTCATFFRCLSFLPVISEIETMHESDLKVADRGTIDFVIFSVGIFVARPLYQHVR